MADSSSLAGPDHQTLLAEYKAAQDSAQHHDGLVWSVASVLLGGSLVLLGLILRSMEGDPVRPFIVALAILGIALTLCVWIFRHQLNDIKRQKYERCKEIELLLGMKQHQNLRYRPGSATIVFSIIMIALILIWLTVICMAACPCAA